LRQGWTVQHPSNRLSRTLIPAHYRAFDGTAQRAEIRTGTNDAIKMWFNGRLVADYQTANGRWAIADDDIVPVTLPSGWSTILVKVAQTVGNWGMYLRITDQNGVPLKGIRVSATRQ